jgi:hypothetical protein
MSKFMIILGVILLLIVGGLVFRSVKQKTPGSGDNPITTVEEHYDSTPRGNKECRQICRAECGGVRPVVGITKNQRQRRACHDTCRSEICNWG